MCFSSSRTLNYSPSALHLNSAHHKCYMIANDQLESDKIIDFVLAEPLP